MKMQLMSDEEERLSDASIIVELKSQISSLIKERDQALLDLSDLEGLMQN